MMEARPRAILLLLALGGCAATHTEYLSARTVQVAAGKPATDGGLLVYDALETTYEGLPADVDPAARDRHGFTPLFAAVFGNDLDALRALIRRGADPSARVEPRVRLRRQHGKASQAWDAAGWTPLHLAAFLRRGEALDVLLAAPADVNARDARGRTPLHAVFLNSYALEGDAPFGDVLGRLIRRGADVDAPDADGTRPLDRAAGFVPGSGDVLRAAGARPTLRWASLKGDLEAARRDLAAGADVNGRDESGWTALHFAASEGHADVVRLLLQAGARTELTNAEGRTALDVAPPDSVVRKLLSPAR